MKMALLIYFHKHFSVECRAESNSHELKNAGLIDTKLESLIVWCMQMTELFVTWLLLERMTMKRTMIADQFNGRLVLD